MSEQDKLSVEVVARNGDTAWQGRAFQVSVPLVDGELGVLSGRQPVLALLGHGTVRVKSSHGQVNLEVDGGFCSVDSDVITVAADQVGALTRDDVAAAREAGQN